MVGEASLKFFVDEGVPDSVANVLRTAGHKVTLLRESGVARGSPDPVVCAFAGITDAILVALDGDMKVLARGHGITGARFKNLSLLKLSCGPVDAAKRVEAALSLIEHEWMKGEGAERRLYIDIKNSVISTYR